MSQELASSLHGTDDKVFRFSPSAFAGVYTEFLMKKNDDSLHWQVGEAHRVLHHYRVLHALVAEF